MATEEDKRLGGKAGASVSDALREELLGSEDILSSEANEFETTVSGIESDLREGREKTEAGIKAGAERARIDVRETGERTLTRGRETARGLGPASTFALIDRIETSTDKSLRDLDLREQEALAAGQTEFANSLAQLKLQSIQFKMQSQANAYNRLFQLGTLEMSEAQEERLKQSEELQQQSDKLSFLRDNNLLQNLSTDDKRELEKSLQLPDGVLDKIKPTPEGDVVTVGSTIGEIVTDENGNRSFKALFTAPSTSGVIGNGTSQTELLGEITQLANLINTAPDLETANSIIASMPPELRPFVKLNQRTNTFGEEELTATINEPTKDQFSELAAIRSAVKSSGLTNEQQDELQSKTGIDVGNLNKVIDLAIDAGEDQGTIVNDLISQYGVSERAAKSIVRTSFNLKGKSSQQKQKEEFEKAEEEAINEAPEENLTEEERRAKERKEEKERNIQKQAELRKKFLGF